MEKTAFTTTAIGVNSNGKYSYNMKQLKQKIAASNFEPQLSFAIFFLCRVKSLYALFINEINDSNLSIGFNKYKNGLNVIEDIDKEIAKTSPQKNTDFTEIVH